MPQRDILQQWFQKIDEDLEFLICCFSEVLTELGEPALAQLLPWLRKPEGFVAVPLAPGSKRELQVLSIAFQLLNLVEENAASQARRARENSGSAVREPGLWEDQLARLLAAGFTAEQIAEALGKVHVEPVFTAHPTESKRPIVLQQHAEIHRLLVELENGMWSPSERQTFREQIKVALERLWRTGEIILVKPDIFSELDHLLHYLREIMPDVLPEMTRRLRKAWSEAGLPTKLVKDASRLPRLSFGDWVGGDRDGHPLVTADVTRKILAQLHQSALTVMRKKLDGLSVSLSLSSLLQPPPARLRKAIRHGEERLGTQAGTLSSRMPDEPWRQFVQVMLARLPASDRRREPTAYAKASELAADLELLRLSLIEVGAVRLAEADIEPVQRLLGVIGFHLAALDIRQNSEFHDRAMEQLLEAAGFEDFAFGQWSEERRLEFLERELESRRPLAPRRSELGTEAKAVLDCYQVVIDYIDAFGMEGIGSLIVSMTRSLSDLLVVFLLCREVGLLRSGPEGPYCLLQVVPLFETIGDLERSPEILDAYLSNPVARRSLMVQNPQRPSQQIMVGYSDSNKDGGFLASYWTLHRALDRLSRMAAQHGVEARFFHGRGGTTSRGAGPTHRFLDALPAGSFTGLFRLTEQGETVPQKYANVATATYNLELLLAGASAATLRHSQPRVEDSWFAEQLNRLSAASFSAYRALLEEPGFMTYWSQATPIDVLEQSSIGSRPARRTGRRTLKDLRAIPWVFSWNQSRHYVPGWYGLGSALDYLHREHGKDFERLKSRLRESPFLLYVLNNAETSNASADLELIREYAAMVAEPEIRNRFLSLIESEHTRTAKMIDLIFGKSRQKRRPRMIKTLRLREEGLRKLHRQQIDLLCRWRALRVEGNDEAAAALLPALLLSVNAISSGQRTTG